MNAHGLTSGCCSTAATSLCRQIEAVLDILQEEAERHHQQKLADPLGNKMMAKQMNVRRTTYPIAYSHSSCRQLYASSTRAVARHSLV